MAILDTQVNLTETVAYILHMQSVDPRNRTCSLELIVVSYSYIKVRYS